MNIESKITKALSHSVCGGWDRSFLESVLEQISRGRELSIKQKQTLGKVLARNTAEDQKKHENWQVDYLKDYKSDAMVLAAYHSHQPYYKPMASDILGGNIPERNKFLRMFNNKYSKKVLAEHAKIARFDVGDYLLPRASFNDFKNVEMLSSEAWISQRRVVKRFVKSGGFVLKIEDEIRSAAKGAKRYRILPVGETLPIIVEERFLKAAKKGGK
tara:strand:- start:2763 stop:3407 length:645 start_codon:yes stop_codon:yes gene_type:complete